MQKRQRTVLDTLRRLPLFTDLSEIELKTIADQVRSQTSAAGAIVFAEGEACRDLLIVEEGAVRLMKTAASGRQQLIGIERRGASLAEVPYLMRGHTPPLRRRWNIPKSCALKPNASEQPACDIPPLRRRLSES